MIIGNAAWGFRETPIEKQLEITSDMGLDVLELSIGSDPTASILIPASISDIENMRKLFNRYGVKLLCGSTGNDFTLAEPEKCYSQLSDVCQVIETASALGIKYLRIFAGFSPVEEVKGKRWDVMIECLQKAAKHAEKHNVILALETHGGVEKKSDMECKHFHSVTTEPDVFDKLLTEIPGTIGINFDPANLGAVGIPKPEKFYFTFKHRIVYMHLKDFAPIPETHYLKPVGCGEGQLNWISLMAAIKNFQGPALIEYENTFDVEDGLKRSLDYLKNML